MNFCEAQSEMMRRMRLYKSEKLKWIKTSQRGSSSQSMKHRNLFKVSLVYFSSSRAGETNSAVRTKLKEVSSSLGLVLQI